MSRREDAGFVEGLLAGMARAQQAASKGLKGKAFDWDKAAKIIAEKRPAKAEAGLAEDWSCTAGTIFVNGRPNSESWAYLTSMWATPLLVLDGEEEIDCWRDKLETDSSEGRWPESALRLLGLRK